MSDKKYVITRTQDEVYLNKSGKPVNGYRVSFDIPAYNEGLTVMVPDLRAETVKAAIEAVVAQRETLAGLG